MSVLAQDAKELQRFGELIKKNINYEKPTAIRNIRGSTQLSLG